MNENQERTKMIGLYHDNIVSITSAVQNAGGSIGGVFQKGMSLSEFLDMCARNNISIKATFKRPEQSTIDPNRPKAWEIL